MVTGRGRTYYRGGNIISFFYISFLLQRQQGDAFQTIKQCASPLTVTRLQENMVNDSISDLDRRAFLKRSVAASSIFFVSLITPPNDVALAEPDDMASAPSTTTPSISEGELTLSEPPPNRYKVEVPSHKEGTKKTADPRFFIAGGASAAISHGVTTPIDVVKTKMQSDSTLANFSPSEAALKIIEDEGPNALAVGLGPTVIGYGIEGAVKFGVYESLKPLFLSSFAGGSSEAYLASAVCAGAMASVILCPMEETRIRLVTDPTFGNGLMDGLPKLLKEDGVLSPFRRGMPPMLSKQVPYTMGKQVSFDLFAGMLYTMLVGLSFVPQKEIALEVEVGAAFLASIVACLMSHPGDVLLTATYKNNEDSSGNGFGETIKKVYSEGGGVPAFFRGLSARFVHVGCIITFQLVIYDQLKQVLGLPASGS
mmetsp:Transcript_5703/g.12539  ORF Transcript_5703/g.12539 Transcript_5703/m.12539 type:complete len:425 (+) Transcript_5703:212-1486(+)|eukprot:CAMPEP_0172528450 /NCGR_PEP_ID=MMETSP1067-20121228/2846_1 /TAXON_ID=265564 ORGANISM="Thalassiosira punctigera, Strain Tpunct2005C2" /NCGR_SAMPLE_ID=MMETSP1067 /ASSEMBLY_ACC=CAM_ASM_000444 /LENGTH=424 /DNA_ID=CAMNT_0013312357 /DNA_START=127 /DNA_END=1401 /DNA_ORIENTATION=-